MHHIAFELKDWAQMQSACDFLGSKNIQLAWGPGRHGPGHNIYTYHRNPDDQIIELFTELDKMLDEKLGYFDPRPWHRDRPQVPKVWDNRRDIWGTPPTPDYIRQRRVGWRVSRRRRTSLDADFSTSGFTTLIGLPAA